MNRFTAMLASVIMATSANAGKPFDAGSYPDILMCRINERMAVVGIEVDKSVYMAWGSQEPWEGMSSHATVGHDVWFWHLDVAGPDWIDLQLQQHDGFISARLWRYDSPRCVQWDISKTFATVSALQHDADFAPWLNAGLDRLGQSRELPDLAGVLIVDYNAHAVVTSETYGDLLALAADLDADDWRTRENASQRLSRIEYLPALMHLANLTNEQRMRVDAILGTYRIETGKETDEKLEEMARGKF